MVITIDASGSTEGVKDQNEIDQTANHTPNDTNINNKNNNKNGTSNKNKDDNDNVDTTDVVVVGEEGKKGEELVGGGGGVYRAALFPCDPLWDHRSWHVSSGESTIRKRMNCLQPQLLFYTSWFCPFAQRTWIALEESNVKYKWKEINPYVVDPKEVGGYTKKALSLEEKKALYPDFMIASPRGLVPAISHEKKVTTKDDGIATTEIITLCESLITAEYINHVYGNSSLIPIDPYENAIMRLWCDYSTNKIQKQFYSALFLSTATDEASIQKRLDHISELWNECRNLGRAMLQINNNNNNNNNDTATAKDGPFLLGKQFTLFEVTFAPFYQRMIWIGQHYLNATEFQFPTIDEPEFLRLDIWWKAVMKRRSVSATFVNKARLIATYSHYSKNIATSDYAKTINQK